MIGLSSTRSILVVVLAFSILCLMGPGATNAQFTDNLPGTANLEAASKFDGNSNTGSGNVNCGGGTKVDVSLSGPTTVPEDQTATYTGESCHQNDDDLTYNWNITTGDQYGSLNVTGTNPPESEFHSDDVTQNRDVTVELEACETGNGNIRCASDQVTTTIVDKD